jgi:hypothetical protein
MGGLSANQVASLLGKPRNNTLSKQLCKPSGRYIGKRSGQGFNLILHASRKNLFYRCLLLSFKILVMGREKAMGNANFL